MTSNNSNRINQLLNASQRGTVLTTAWLKEHSISNKLAWWHLKSGWLEHIGGGAYYLTGDRPTWTSAVAALQQQLHLPLHVGGKTALQLLGKSHYVSATLREIQLFAPTGTKPPAWLHSNYWQEKFTLYCSLLFAADIKNSLVSYETNGLTVNISAPERAAIELCYLVPDAVTFEEAALILEGLNRLRPKLMQQLLENCRSYKAKRLLLYLADFFNHPWLPDLDLARINLGKGKRAIAGGGQYNAKYQISVPVIGSHVKAHW